VKIRLNKELRSNISQELNDWYGKALETLFSRSNVQLHIKELRDIYIEAFPPKDMEVLQRYGLARKATRITLPVGGTLRRLENEVETEEFLIPREYAFRLQEGGCVASGLPDSNKALKGKYKVVVNKIDAAIRDDIKELRETSARIDEVIRSAVFVEQIAEVFPNAAKFICRETGKCGVVDETEAKKLRDFVKKTNGLAAKASK